MKPSLISQVLILVMVAAVERLSRAEDERHLGSLLFADTDLSRDRNQSCATCHSPSSARDATSGVALPAPGFVDPENVSNNTPVSQGSLPGTFGSLNTPSAAYAAHSPEFHWDAPKNRYLGGQFWNGRAANLEAQATGPFLNPVEMAMPSPWSVVTRIRANTDYRRLFRTIYGIDLGAIPAYELAPATSPPPTGVSAAFEAAAQAIAEFERTRTFNKFNSKFDFWLAGRTILSSNEERGLNLFNNKAGCSTCHPATFPNRFQGDRRPPLLTDFSYHNLGLPRNWSIPGSPSPDPGLGGRLDIAATQYGFEQLGKHKVPSLRNVAITPPYGHNGVFTSLEQVVHFYNTRNVLGPLDSNTDVGFGVRGWPQPETSQNVNRTDLGNLGLLPREEADLIAFLKTLTDDFPATGLDPNVPPGTPSPFTDTSLPRFQIRLGIGPATIEVRGQLGRSYGLESAESMGEPVLWQRTQILRTTTSSKIVSDYPKLTGASRFFRAVELP